MKNLFESKKFQIVIRILGVPVGLMMLGFTFAGFVPLVPEGDPQTRDVFGIVFSIFFAALTICLLVPYRLIKNAQAALWFFRIFLALSIVLVFGTNTETTAPLLWVFQLIIIFANVWVSYLHYKRLEKA